MELQKERGTLIKEKTALLQVRLGAILVQRGYALAWVHWGWVDPAGAVGDLLRRFIISDCRQLTMYCISLCAPVTHHYVLRLLGGECG
jgi:hypothetical protein